MHTGTQIYPQGFEIDVDGRDGLDALLPGRHRLDRFGIVVAEPFGALGASLLIQACVANWFESRPERRDSAPAYPEIYAFHLGGPHGDHSAFDFWPPRKEVFVAAQDAVAMLTEINARAITRLAIPDGSPGDPRNLTWGPSTWAEQQALRDRVESVWAYSAAGSVAGADVRIVSTDPRLEENPRDTFELPAVGEALLRHEDEGFEGYLPGFSEPADNHRWVDTVRARRHEVPVAVREALRAERSAAGERSTGIRTETYRRLDVEDALRMIAAWA
jgi:hypothetical protein